MKKRIITIFLITAIGLGFFLYRRHVQSFSTQRWLATEEEDRLSLAKSFLEKHDIVGMHLKQVQNLLGEPSWKEVANSSGRLIYVVGHIYIDDVWMVLEFENEKVTKAYLMQTT